MRVPHHGGIEIGAAAAVRPHAEQDRIDARIPKDRVGDLRHGDRGPVTFHRRPRVNGIVHAASEGVHPHQAGPGGGRKPRHLDSELIRVIGGDHPGTARGADRRYPSRRSRGAHQRIRGSEIDEVDELASRNDPGLCEQPAGDPARNREIRGMRSARIRPRLGPSDQCRHHGLATRHGSGRMQQPRSLRKPFQVQCDHRGGRVLDEVLEHVGRPHVAGVAEGGHRAHPETGSFHELVEQAGHVDSALSDDADAALAHPRQVDERSEEAIAGVDEPTAVRTPHRNAGFAGALHHALLKRLSLLARFGETRRGHQHRADSPGDARLEDGQHVAGRSQDDREVDRPLDRVERAIAAIPGDAIRVRIDREDLARVVAAEVVHLVEAGLARRSRCADDGNAARLEEAARGVVAGRSHRNGRLPG